MDWGSRPVNVIVRTTRNGWGQESRRASIEGHEKSRDDDARVYEQLGEVSDFRSHKLLLNAEIMIFWLIWWLRHLNKLSK